MRALEREVLINGVILLNINVRYDSTSHVSRLAQDVQDLICLPRLISAQFLFMFV